VQVSDRRVGYYDQKLETMPPEERRAHESSLVVEMVRYAHANSPAMRRMLHQSGVPLEDIRTVENLAAVPVTRKSQLLEYQREKPPFGDFLAVPIEELRHIFVSPGPIFDPGYYDPDQVKTAATLLYAAGFRKGDIVLNTFSYHFVPAGLMFDEGLQAVGCVVVPAGGGNTDLQVSVMKTLGVTGYVGTPSFLHVIANRGEEAGLNLQRDLTLEVGYCSAEMLPESLRHELQERFAMLIRQSYGTADVGLLGYECSEMTGMHVPENVLIEIVDPETGIPVPCGEVGEVVASVCRRAYPLIRFGTGDLSYLSCDPCPCGRTSARLMKILGRVDQVTKVRGMFVHPSQVEEVLAGFPEIGNCQVVVTREHHADAMTWLVELAQEVDRPSLAQRLIASVRNVIKLRAEVEFVPAGTIPAGSKRIVDERKWD